MIVSQRVLEHCRSCASVLFILSYGRQELGTLTYWSGCCCQSLLQTAGRSKAEASCTALGNMSTKCRRHKEDTVVVDDLIAGLFLRASY